MQSRSKDTAFEGEIEMEIETDRANGESTMRDPLQRPELTEVLGCWGRADSQAGKWCGEELGHPTSALGAAGCRVKTRC